MSIRISREEFINFCDFLRETKDDGSCYTKDTYVIHSNLGEGIITRHRVGPCLHLTVTDVILKSDLIIKGRDDKTTIKFTAVLEGEIQYNYDNETRVLKKNSISVDYYTKSYNEVSIKKNQRLRYVTLIGRENYMEKNPFILEQFNIKEKENISISLSNPNIMNILNDIYTESFSPDLQEMFLRSKATDIIVYGIHSYKNSMKKSQIFNDEDLKRIHLAKKHINENFKQDITISSLAKIVALNEFKLKKGFKEIFDDTIFAYLQEVRMGKAKDLLKSSEFSIKEIANQVGYKSQSSFTYTFAKKFGFLPKEYQKENRV